MSNKQNFIKGTFILVIANAVSKILGAVFKIPLTYILREEGMAIYSTAFSVYIMILSFITSGVSMAISKMVAEELALKHKGEARKIVATSTALLAAAGLFGSAVMFFGAEFFAGAMKDLKAAHAIRMLSPSIFFVAVGMVYKSYYQGRVNMVPTAVSQVIEALVRLFAGYALAVFCSKFAMEITAAGAIAGVTIGEFVATAVLIALYLPDHRRLAKYKAANSSKKICLSIGAVAVPMIISSSVSSTMNLADITVIRSQLLKITFTPQTAEQFLLCFSSYTTLFDNLLDTLRLSVDGARWLYGAYSGYALTIFHLPVGIMATLGVSILPVIAGALAQNRRKQAEYTAGVAMKITMLAALPCAVMLALFSEPLLELLFHNSASSGMLRLLAPCLLFVCVSQLLTAILNASGQIVRPFVHGLVGMCFKLAGNLLLVSNPHLHIMGAVISANISYFVVVLLDYIAVRRRMHIRFDVRNTFIKPLLSAAVMGAVMALLYRPMCIIFSNETAALAATGFVGCVTYAMMLFLTTAVTKKELKNLKMGS